MKIILPSFASLVFVALLSMPQVAAAQAPAVPAIAAGTEENPEALMQRMSAAIGADRSISARIRLHADLFGNQMLGTGVYLQQGVGADRQMRLEIKIQLGDRPATLQQICDGNFLWQFHDLSDKPSLTRVDLHRVQEALDRSGRKAALPAALTNGCPAGGLPQLIDSLRQTFRFTRAQAGQLETLPVWIVDGSLLPEAIATQSADSGKKGAESKPPDLKKLPPQMPEEVLLYLGQDDLFPYRIEYRRRPARQTKGNVADTTDPLPILIVELYEVRLNSPIDPQQFVYQPGGLEVLDTTDHVLKGLGAK